MSLAIKTERLELRRFTIDDADFIVRLLNQPSFLEFIGDRGVRTLDDAVKYIENGPLKSYEERGHGLFAVRQMGEDEIMGMAGVVKKPWLPDPDLAYAFLPDYWSQGFAYEAAAAVLTHVRTQFDVGRVVAVIAENNHASVRVVEKLGMQFEGMIADPQKTALKLYASGPA